MRFRLRDYFARKFYIRRNDRVMRGDNVIAYTTDIMDICPPPNICPRLDFSPPPWPFENHHREHLLPVPDHNPGPTLTLNRHLTFAPSGKGSPYSITERRVPELIPVLSSQPAGDVSHKPGGRLSLLSVRPAVTPATLKRAATNFPAWWTEAQWV